MQYQIKEELQQLISADVVSSEELSDAELESVAGGVIVANGRISLRVNGATIATSPVILPTNLTARYCAPAFLIFGNSAIENFRR